MGISQCPEGRRVFPQQTVYENMRLGAYTRKGKSIESDIEKHFEKVPRLKERKDQPARLLYGGEQHMLVICRTLMSQPKLLLLDEPTMGLAPMVVSEIFNLVRVVSEQGTNIMLVEQNAKRALGVFDKCYVLEIGRIDILVNNAGIFPAAPLVEITEEQWDPVLAVNLKCTFLVTQEVARRAMIPQQAGRIISISSCDAKAPT